MDMTLFLRNIPILAYHKITNKIGWGINNVPVRFFYRQMHYLHENGFRTVSVNDFLSGGIAEHAYRKKVVLTFDDADVSVYENAFPIMQKFGFTGTLFVITDFVGKKDMWDANPVGRHSSQMDWLQIKELVANGWTVGSHSISHRDLTSLTTTELYGELKGSKEILEKELNIGIKTISYPFNRFNSNVLEKAFEAGYEKGFILGSSHFQSETKPRLAIPRLGIYLIDFMRTFQSKLAGNKFEFFKQNIISRFSYGSVLWKKIFF